MRLTLASTALVSLLLGGCVVAGPYPATGRVYSYEPYPSSWYGSDIYYYSYEPGPGYYYRPGYGYYRPGRTYTGPRYPYRDGHDHRDRDHDHRDRDHDHDRHGRDDQARDEPRPDRPDHRPDRPRKPEGGHRGWPGVAAGGGQSQERPPERPARDRPSRLGRAPEADEPSSGRPDGQGSGRRRGWDRWTVD